MSSTAAGGWIALEQRAHDPVSAVLALLWVSVALAVAFGSTSAVPEIGGPLESWFSNLAISQPKNPLALEQSAVALAAGGFLMSSANRFVRLILMVAQTQTQKAESTLRGGRLIGPMERLFIGAMLVAGEPTGIAIVIAAKGLLRLPEIHRGEGRASVDEVTEYFLIGTFTSMLIGIAAAGAVLVLG